MIVETGHLYLSGGEFDAKDEHWNQHCVGQTHRHIYYSLFGVSIIPAFFAQVQTYVDYRYLSIRGLQGQANYRSLVTVRSFNHSCTGVGVIAQESQCQGFSIIHQQGETQSMFVAGPLVVPNSQQCYVSISTVTDVPTAQPSPTPSPSGPPTGAPTIVSTTSLPTVNPTRLSNILSTWLEIGAITVRSDTFVQVTGKVTTFKKRQVFIGLPDHGNAALYSGYSSCFRLDEITNTTLNPGPISFQVRVTQPNDSWCNYTWWTPVIEPAQHVYYMIVETGHWYLSGG
eukprot:gene1859-2186_t